MCHEIFQLIIAPVLVGVFINMIDHILDDRDDDQRKSPTESHAHEVKKDRFLVEGNGLCALVKLC